ncbi:MAG: HEAT repeat domain-containing protein [Polyangiales bacterium]
MSSVYARSVPASTASPAQRRRRTSLLAKTLDERRRGAILARVSESPKGAPAELADVVETILAALADAPRETVDRLREDRGEPGPIVAALVRAPDTRSRRLLCDVLGFRKERVALDALVACLDDEAPGVRAAAADALAKLADERAGPALLARARMPESHLGTLAMIVAALGAVGHAPAVPLLVTFLRCDEPSLRGSAAWALGALRAIAALPDLRAALARERWPYPAERIRAAIAALGA